MRAASTGATTGMVTPVKAQGACGSCYAFAAAANFESRLLISGESRAYDFSENNIKECNWYDASCVGGNYYKVASFLSKKGTILETCDPYVPSNVGCSTSCPYQKTLLDWRIISERYVANTNTLKSYIQTYGPVYTTLYTGNGDAWDTEFNNYNGSYTLHYAGAETTNHAVLIVGWDDSLPHEGGSGGWIMKNSWGTDWGGPCGYGSERGYFTIAYGSASIGMYTSFVYDWQDYDTGGGLMYHDEGGWTIAYGYGSTTAWGLCRFTPLENTSVTRVEFWTTDATTSVDIYLYDDFNVSTRTPSSLLHSDLNHSFDEAGYHSVAVDPPVPVTAGDDIIAVVRFTNQSYGYPVAVDDRGPNVTQRTYLSKSGNDGSWADLGSEVGVDAAIRLRTSSAAPTPTTTISPSPTPTTTVSPSPTSHPTTTVSPSPPSHPTPTRTPGGPGALVYLPLVEKNWGAGPESAPALYPVSAPDNDGTFNARWSRVPGATSYSLQEASNPTFTGAHEAYGGPATSTILTGRRGGTYFYRARGRNALGYGPWSNVQSVTVSPPSTQPGNWSGTTITGGYPSKPKTLSFVVNPGGTAMFNPEVITYYECWTGSTTIGWTVTWTIGHDITINPDGTFYFDEDFNYGLHHLTWRGRFTSPHTAEGTYTFTHWTAQCGEKVKSGIWTASYVGPSSKGPSHQPAGIHAVVERQE